MIVALEAVIFAAALFYIFGISLVGYQNAKRLPLAISITLFLLLFLILPINIKALIVVVAVAILLFKSLGVFKRAREATNHR